MKEQVLDILKDGINDIDSVKKQYPKMNTQDVVDALRRLQDRINELTIPVVINWVACKDRLPISGKYYVTWDGHRIEKTYRYDNPKFFTNEREVTHWMELPEPPCL